MGVNPDDLLAVLSNRDCRDVLRELSDGPRTVSELGAALTAEDRDERDAATAVHHVLVPKLRDAGLVTVDDGVVSIALESADADSAVDTPRKHV
jgi:DNA-binding transcriptional ArsR family regulator